jgi:hypothetical protein
VPDAVCDPNTSRPPFTCGWSASFQAGSFYHLIPRVYCRTCHVANPFNFNWQNATLVKQRAALVCSVLSSFYMPFAEVPYNRLWNDNSAQKLINHFLGCNLAGPKPK